MTKLYPSFRRYALENGLMSEGDTVVVSVSGGVDSIVLLDLTARMSKTLGITPVVAHVNHGLRGRESERDEEFVRGVAKSRGLRFVAGRLKPRRGANLQDSARRLRRGFLVESARRFGASSVALGHNRGDQAETILMHLLRGASLPGLCGMGSASVIDGVKFVRPILFASRNDIAEYARSREIDYREDSTNRGTRYRRNELRHSIVPALERINPRIEESLAAMGSRLREEEEVLFQIALAAYEEAMLSEEDDSVSISRRHLCELPSAIRRRVLGIAFDSLAGSRADLNSDQLARMDSIASSAKADGEYRLPAPWRFSRRGEILRIEKDAPGAKA